MDVTSSRSELEAVAAYYDFLNQYPGVIIVEKEALDFRAFQEAFAMVPEARLVDVLSLDSPRFSYFDAIQYLPNTQQRQGLPARPVSPGPARHTSRGVTLPSIPWSVSLRRYGGR